MPTTPRTARRRPKWRLPPPQPPVLRCRLRRGALRRRVPCRLRRRTLCVLIARRTRRRATMTWPSPGWSPSKSGCGAAAAPRPLRGQRVVSCPAAASRRADAALRYARRVDAQAFYLMRGGNAAELRGPGCAAAAAGTSCRNPLLKPSPRRADAAAFESPETRIQAQPANAGPEEEEDPDVAFARALQARAQRGPSSHAPCSPRLRPRRAGGGGARMEHAHAGDGGPARARRCVPRQLLRAASAWRFAKLTHSAQRRLTWRPWASRRRTRRRTPSTSTP